MSHLPTASQALALVAAAVALVLEVDPSSLRSSTSLVDDLVADSVSLIEIIEVTEASLRTQGFPVTFDDSQLAGLMTVGDIVDHITAQAQPPGRTLAAA